jgi:chemotaxis signal transduction protein
MLSRPKEVAVPDHMQAIVIFRIGEEYLAVSTAVVGQVTEMKPIHHVPHQRNKIIRGCVNINGQLRLFVSMTNLLEIGSDKEMLSSVDKCSMMVIENESDVWAFAVAEVCGIHHCDMRQLKNVPVNVAKSTANYIKGVLLWNSQNYGYLDDELLFFSLRKCLL